MDVIRSLGSIFSEFLAAHGLLAIFAVMLLKEFGVPIPVPSDLIMITAGVQASLGGFTVLELFVGIWIAMLIGGSGQFLIARSAGREFVYRLSRIVGLTQERLDSAVARLRARGPVGIFIGLNIPGARAGIIPAAGLLGMRFPTFVITMFAGSTLFYGWHIALGYIAGPSATAILEGLQVPTGAILGALFVVGLFGWAVLRGRSRAKSGPERKPVDRLHSFTHAACPVCLVAAAVEQRSSIRKEKPA